MKEKIALIVLCSGGIAAIFFGMVKENNGVFVVGIILVIGGYLMIRKRLKESVPKKKGEFSDENNKKNQ